ncbi:MAG TPA: dTDP-4-dehydrorhamnose reductase [Kofleriaceae bacterium]|nr:dTDP-4-dehydrorhamnose reductase [Kofleriaceae bacterium]
MTVLVTGGRGQLGRSLAAHRGVIALGADALDVREPAQIAAALARHAPALVINAAAYTAVDRAEAEPAAARAVNTTAVDHLARACRDRRTPWIHVSTDHVFDGRAAAPYREDDPVAPRGVYGQSKADGEAIARAAGATIVRTSWLFATGGARFVQAVLRRAIAEPALRVVADQHGCPTWADDLAAALLRLAALRAPAATYHFCGDGATTRHGFAAAIVAEARRHRALACTRIDPIASEAGPAPRPAYAVLDTSRIRALGIVPPAWTIGLARVVGDEVAAGAA